MTNEIDANINSFSYERETRILEIDALKVSRIKWVALTIVVGLFIGLWYGGEQRRHGYELGLEAGQHASMQVHGIIAQKPSTTSDFDTTFRNCENK